VQANKLDNVYQYFKQWNPHLCEESVWSANGTDDVVRFPIIVPEGALTKADFDAIKHLDVIRRTQENWVLPGTTKFNKRPVNHNVSCTVIVKDDEWTEVIKYLYKHRNSFAAVSLLAASGDKDYAQAPMEAIGPDDVEKFIADMNWFWNVDYTQMLESEDGTSLMQEGSCYGGACEIKV
jgi:ribonucleoside-diphosphate reductase alpha chain